MLSLEDVLALPHDPSEEHLRSIGLLPQVPPTPSIVPHLGTGEKIPALSPVTSAAPAPPADWRARLSATVPHAAASSAPLPPLSPVTAPELGTPSSPEMPTTSESATPGVNFPKLAPLNFKERQALPTTSEGVAPGSKESAEAQLARLRDQQQNPWGSPENHPGLLGKIGHYAAKIGNIAGDVIAPATMANIPGTDLNRQVQEHGLERQIAKAGEAEETAKSNEAKRGLETAQAGEAEAREEALRNPKGEKAENIAQLHADAVQDAIDRGVDPGKDPKVLQIEDSIQRIQKPANLPEAEKPLAERVGQLNAVLAKRYQVIHKGQNLPAEYTLPANATQKDYDRLDKTLEAEEKATGTQAQLAEINQARQQAERDKIQHENETRSDKSFQFNKGELEKMAKPIDDAMARMSRLRDTIGQGTPQADALVAPELLTVMAGGAGSGLRMNEAEISRIVGGRSKWQDLEAAINKWSLDPSTANSITMEQRADIKKLVDAVHAKLVVKNNAINDARQQLISTDEPKEHRKIAADTEKKLNSIDNGQNVTEKNYSQADVDDAIKAHPGATAEQIEAAFKKKGWVKK